MRLENDQYRVRINTDNGSIVSFFDKNGVGEVIAEAWYPMLGGPFAEHEDARWSTFRNSETGRRACLLVNLSDEPLEADSVALADNADGVVMVCQPFEPDQTARLPVTITIPPERFTVLAET